MTTEYFRKEYGVRYYEVDFAGFIRPVTILNFLQDAASCHAALLGVSVTELRKLNLIWVLSRFHLHVDRYAREGETLVVTTWPSTKSGHFTCREFEIHDGAGVIIAKATSSWAALDMSNRRPVQLEVRLPPYDIIPRRAIDDEFTTLPQLVNEAQELDFPVRRSDLDTNLHVNNTVYVDWALEAAPRDVAEHLRPASIEVGFRSEVFYGDRVVSRCGSLPGESPTLIHQLVDSRDRKELTRLRTVWCQF